MVTSTDRRTRRGAIALATAMCCAAFTIATPAHHHTDPTGTPDHGHAGELAGGHVGVIDATTPAMFWETPLIECTGEPSITAPSAPRGCVDQPTMTWSIDVAGPADQLRVDWDQPYRQDTFTLHVTGPAGERASQSSHNTYSEGVRIDDPTAGRWVVELEPGRTDGTRVRLRAGLVDGDRPSGSQPLLPNLRVTPPFEFGFAAPANPTNSVFLAGDDQNPPMTFAEATTNSCTADEVQEAADPTQTEQPTALLRCLRFSVGPQNAGAGHFDLRFPIADRAQHDQDRVFEMTQVIHHANPLETTERPAGTYEYHATHGHYHYLDVLHYQAFEVTDAATGELEPVGIGRKSGFCPVDQGYADWASFAQSLQDALREHQDGDCLAVTGNGSMGLSAGWGDFYRWQRPGQYVDFTGVGDGTYVVRTTVDIHDNVLESDETDNSSYALIEVVGDEVEVLERGYGTSPFDPDRQIADDHRT